MVQNAVSAISDMNLEGENVSVGAASLDRVRSGTSVIVVSVQGGDAIARRLVDLGFRPGTEVHVMRVAPLGDPVQFRLHGYRLALRKSEARRVLVTARR